MKWFKHYSDASRGDLLSKINREFGLAGEARWWRLIELMAERYPVDNDCFLFTSELLRRSMSFRSVIDLGSFLDRLQIHSGLIVNRLGNDYELIYSKLAEIKDNHTNNLQVTCRKVSLDKTRLDKTRTDKIRLDKNKESSSDDYQPFIDLFNSRIDLINSIDESNLRYAQVTTKLKALIRQRLKEYSPEQLNFVIRNKSNDDWLVDNGFYTLQKIMRPEKFESYLQEPEYKDRVGIVSNTLAKLRKVESEINNENA